MRHHGLRALLLLLLVVASGCGENRFVEMSDRLRGAPTVGVPAPDYHGVKLQGDSLRLADLRGQVVLINAWTTWCNPCVAEFPVLEQLHRKYGPRGLALVGISIDRLAPEQLQQFLAEHGVTYPNLRDRDHRLESTFGWGKGVPHTLLIDREGVIARYWVGAVDAHNDRQQAALEALLEELLGS